MPLPVIYGLVILWFGLLGYLFTRARQYEYDYNVLPDVMRKRREEAVSSSSFQRLIEPLVSTVAALLPRLGLEATRARTRRLLVHSGNPRGHTAETYLAQAIVYAILAWTATLVLFLLVDGSVRPFHGILPAVVVYLLQLSNLKTEAERRRVLIDRHVPYFLDLMVLTMGAGSTFLEACETITAGATTGPLVEEIGIMVAEVRAGTRFPDALANMTRRSDSEELALMVQAVRQGEELGTPLVDIFETQASTNRYRRTKRGEQIAARLPNRLALPNTVLMLAVLLLLFGPIIVKAMRGELL